MTRREFTWRSVVAAPGGYVVASGELVARRGLVTASIRRDGDRVHVVARLTRWNADRRFVVEYSGWMAWPARARSERAVVNRVLTAVGRFGPEYAFDLVAGKRPRPIREVWA